MTGSPPHTWRKPAYVILNYRFLRITSTYVEKTRSKLNLARLSQDHLHIRGENLLQSVPFSTRLGSPPHTWRKLEIDTLFVLQSGITSTYVEKTPRRTAKGSKTMDHLHIRGENFICINCKTVARGSPPHTWRKLYLH